MRRRRRFLGSAAVLAASALVLTACGSSGSSGSGTSTAASQGKAVTIGLSSILSGPYAVYGEVGQGIQGYLDMVNASGGVNGHTFNVLVKDNGYQSTQAIAITRGFVTDGALAVFELGTPATQAALTLGNEMKVPLIAAANGDLFAPPTTQYAFTVDSQFSRQALYQAQFIMQNLHTKQWAFAYQDDDTGTPAANVVPTYVKDQGGKLLTDISVSPTATDFSDQAAELKSSGAKVVQAFLGTATFIGLQKAAAAIGYHPTWVTFFTQADPAYPAAVGSLANGVYVDSFLDITGSEVAAFQTAMTKYYPKLVNSWLAELGWSQAAILIQGIKKATKGGAALTTSSLTQALSSLAGVPAGFIPSIGFNAQTHAASSEDSMFIWDGSTLKQVTPYADMPNIPAGTSPLS
jgi:branched-chain amino acid transport system substrate-binding protein